MLDHFLLSHQSELVLSQATSAFLLGAFGGFFFLTVPCGALGTSTDASGGTSGSWELPGQSERDPRPCPVSAKALLFMYQLDWPLRIHLKGGFHRWERFENHRFTSVQSMQKQN